MMSDDVRPLALALPEAVEADHHGSPSFRVRGKIFCTLRPGTPRMMVKLDGEDQRNFCETHPEAIEPVPGYWGRKGSTFVDCSALDEANHNLARPRLARRRAEESAPRLKTRWFCGIDAR